METVAALGMARKDTEEVDQQILSLRVRENPESRIFNLGDGMDDTINRG